MTALRVRVTALALAAALSASFSAPGARAEAPRPKAGIVPTDLDTVAAAKGPSLESGALDTTLSGKRVRFVAQVAETGRTPAGEAVLVLADGGTRVIFRMPDVLERAERLTPGASPDPHRSGQLRAVRYTVRFLLRGAAGSGEHPRPARGRPRPDGAG